MIIDESFKTQETAAYVQVTHYQDSTPMQDQYCDGILYRKQDALYFRRTNADPLNVLWFGLKNDGTTYNELALNHLFDTVYGPLNLFFPQGIYRFKALPASLNVLNQPVAIRIQDRQVRLLGEIGTQFLIDPGCIGIQVVTGRNSATQARIEDLEVVAAGKDPNDGKVAGPNGPVWGTNAGNDYKFNGINLFAQGYLRNVSVSNFSGHGVCVYGALDTKINTAPVTVPGTTGQWNGDLTFTPDDPYFFTNYAGDGAIIIDGYTRQMGGKVGNFFTMGYYNNGVPIPAGQHYADTQFIYPGIGLITDNCQFDGINNFGFNGGCGLFINGSDSNQGTYNGVSVRENGLWGIFDQSFLGSHFVGAHGTSNGRNFSDNSVGAFCTDPDTACSTWLGCYTEADQGPSKFGSSTTVIGGIHAAGISRGFYQLGSQANFFDVGALHLRPERLSFALPNRADLLLRSVAEDNGQLGFIFGEYGPAQLSFLDGTASLPQSFRTLTSRGISIPNLVAGGVQVGSASSINDLFTRDRLQVMPGDYYVNTSCDGTTPAGWRCISGGTIGTLSAGIQGVPNSSSLEFTPNNELRSGDYVQVGSGPTALYGKLLSYLGVSQSQGGPAFATDHYQGQAQPAAVSYIAPRLRAVGDGVGPINSRPQTMRADDAGWRYFDTTNSVWFTWTGTAWV